MRVPQREPLYRTGIPRGASSLTPEGATLCEFPRGSHFIEPRSPEGTTLSNASSLTPEGATLCEFPRGSHSICEFPHLRGSHSDCEFPPLYRTGSSLEGATLSNASSFAPDGATLCEFPRGSHSICEFPHLRGSHSDCEFPPLYRTGSSPEGATLSNASSFTPEGATLSNGSSFTAEDATMQDRFEGSFMKAQ